MKTLRDKLLMLDWSELPKRTKVVGMLYEKLNAVLNKADNGSDSCTIALLNMSNHYQSSACTAICQFKKRIFCTKTDNEKIECIISEINDQ